MPDYEEAYPSEAEVAAILEQLGFGGAPAPEPSSGGFSGSFAPAGGPLGPAIGYDTYGVSGDDVTRVGGTNAVNVPVPPPASEPSRDAAPSNSWSGSFNPDRPYAVPDMADTPAGRRMEGALGMVANLFGVGNGRAEVGTAGGAYRDDWERRNPGRNFDDTVIDYRGSGIDTSGMEKGGLPVVRVNAITGKQLAAEPLSNWNDLRSIPGSVPMRDDKGEVLLDDQGRTRRYDLPGWNGQQRFEGNLRPDRLENGQRVFYDPNNNLTYGVGADGRPDRLLPGGLNYQGGASGGAYGLNPTTLNGRPVFYDEQGARTFERNGDRIGRNIANGGPGGRSLAWMDGGSGGGGGGFAPPPPKVFGNGQLGPNDTLLEGSVDRVGNVGLITSGNGWAMPYRRMEDGSLQPYGDPIRLDNGGGGTGEKVGNPVTIDNAGYVVINPQGGRVNVPPGSVTRAVADANGQPIGTFVQEPNGNQYIITPSGQRRTFDTAPATRAPGAGVGSNGGNGGGAVSPPNRPVGGAATVTVPLGGYPDANLGASGEPLPPPSLAQSAGENARGTAGMAAGAAGNAAIAANDQIERGRAANELVWDAATQSWRTQAEIAADAARRAGGGIGGAARDFARGFIGR